MLPFTRDEFMAVFARYHLGTWPAVMVWFILAVFLLSYLYRHSAERPRASFLLLFLGILWGWTGGVYMWKYFAAINPAAILFGVLFIVQGMWLLYEAGKLNLVDVSIIPRPQLYVSAFLLLYALVLYPLIGGIFGHRYPAAPIFGLPCPNTIFTFASLLIVSDIYGKPLMRLMIIPGIWSVIATVAAIDLGVPEDWMLPVATVASFVLLTGRKRRTRFYPAIRI